MMTGEINADREAELRLTVYDAARRETEIKAVIDTGFTDYLTLPLNLIASLSLPFRESAEFVLADGHAVAFETYAASVLWDGVEKPVLVLAAEGGPLVGMSLLYGCRVIMDVVDGGSVTIEAKLP
jgi:clan AA aspartic protease